jgi:hypothetical protein
MAKECIYTITIKDEGKQVAKVLVNEPETPIIKFMREATAQVEQIFAGFHDETHTVEVSLETLEVVGANIEPSLSTALKKIEQLAEERLTCDLDA